MKFGKTLVAHQHPPWNPHYVNYKSLKKVLKEAEKFSHTSSNQDKKEVVLLRHQFKFSLHSQVRDATAFWLQKLSEITELLRDIPTTLPAAEIARLCEELRRLSEFGLVNYLAVLKIIKKHDKFFQENRLGAIVVPSVLESPLLSSVKIIELVRKLAGQAGDGEAAASIEAALTELQEPLEHRVSTILNLDDVQQAEEDRNKYAPTVVRTRQSDFALEAAQRRIVNVSRVLNEALSKGSVDHPGLGELMRKLGVPHVSELKAPFTMTHMVVGEGSFGRVFCCERDGLKAAAKVIPATNGSDMSKIVGEVSALLACQQRVAGSGHQYVLDVKQIFYDDSGSEVTVVSSLCDQELYEEVVTKAPFSDERAGSIFVQLIQGLNHIHSCGFCHRDIKLENLLLLDNKLIIADFGFAVAWGDEQGLVVPHNRKCGSIAYIAPEGYHGENYDGRTLDVWSAGVIMFVLVCASFPFECPSEKCSFFASHLAGKTNFPNNVNPAIREVIMWCLQLDVLKRATCADLLSHRWCKAAALKDELPPPPAELGSVAEAPATTHETNTTKHPCCQEQSSLETIPKHTCTPPVQPRQKAQKTIKDDKQDCTADCTVL